MTKALKTLLFMASIGAISGVTALNAQAGSRYNGQKTNHAYRHVNVIPPMPAPYRGVPANHSRHKFHKQSLVPRPLNPAYRTWGDKIKGRKQLAYQIPPRPAPYGPQFQRWVDYEPQYTLYPGDQLDIVVPSAPELSRTLTVGPDGRIVMPNVTPVMAAGRTITHVQNALSAQLSTLLRDPKIAVTPRAYSSQQIYIGGEVGQQGTFAMPGPIGVMEGILLAGGLRGTAKTGHVAVLRRAPNGGMMMRTVNLKNGLRNIREYNDNMQLRRGDIIFVPRNSLAEIGVFMSNFRGALPVDFNLSYQFGSNGGGTTVVSP